MDCVIKFIMKILRCSEKILSKLLISIKSVLIIPDYSGSITVSFTCWYVWRHRGFDGVEFRGVDRGWVAWARRVSSAVTAGPLHNTATLCNTHVHLWFVELKVKKGVQVFYSSQCPAPFTLIVGHLKLCERSSLADIAPLLLGEPASKLFVLGLSTFQK